MNTKKALIVIMVLLILMNIALASYIIVISTNGKSGLSTEEYVSKILDQRNIIINCKIPNEIPSASSIVLGDMLYSESAFETLVNKTGGAYSLDDHGRMIFTNISAIETVQEEMNRSVVEKITHEFINNIGLQLEEFSLDVFIGTGTDEYKVRYTSKDEKGIYYYDSYIEMTVNKYGVAYGEIYVKRVKDIEVNNADGLPIHTILLSNLVSESKKVEIDSISFGYHQKEADSSESVMSWRIGFGDGSERFFEVSTGVEITPILDILEFSGIITKCKIPKPFSGNSSVLYGQSSFTTPMLDSMTVFMNGDANIDGTGLITYIRTSFQNSASYTLNSDTIAKICTDFIDSIGKNANDYLPENTPTITDGVYTVKYVYKDDNNHLYFDNFIEIHFSELGVIFAAFRDDDFVLGKVFPDSLSVGALLPEVLNNENEEYIIVEIQKGYKRDDNESQTAFACWKIVFEDGSIRYFTVDTGEELNIK